MSTRRPMADADAFILGTLSAIATDASSRVRYVSGRVATAVRELSIDQTRRPYLRELATDLDLARLALCEALNALQNAGVTPDYTTCVQLSPPPAGGDRQTPDLTSAAPGPILPGANPCDH